MNLAEEYSHSRLDIKIYYDEQPESPREWDNFGTMICSHRRHMLGDEQFDVNDYHGWADLKKRLIEERGAVIVLPLSLYDHSGISMTVGELHGWDSGQVGFIYLTKEDFDKELEADPTYTLMRADKCLRGEVETYNQYLTGDVYGYQVINPKDGEEIDQQWGLYGVKDAKHEAECAAENFKHPHDAAYAKGASQLHG